MKDIQQLIKRDNQEGKYKDIFPQTYIEAISDKQTGVGLDQILNSFNMYFLSYQGNAQSTRLQVIDKLRRKGLWITYVTFENKIVTEWYNSDDITDSAWGSNSNWMQGSNMLVGDISISSSGTWVVDGVDTGVLAQGPKGEPGTNGIDGTNGVDGKTPQLRATSTYIQYSYDGLNWVNIISLEAITGPAATNDVGTTETLVYGSKAYVKNVGNTHHAIFDFGLVTGPPGSQGQTGAPAQIMLFANTLPAYNATFADKLVAVGTATPYTLWYGSPTLNAFVEMGLLMRLKQVSLMVVEQIPNMVVLGQQIVVEPMPSYLRQGGGATSPDLTLSGYSLAFNEDGGTSQLYLQCNSQAGDSM